MKKIFFSSIFISLIAVQSVFAWGFHTHRKITADAVRLMPEAFKNRFGSQKSSFLSGCTDPDTLIKDFNNHVYYPDGTHPDGFYRIQDIYNKLVEMIAKDESTEKIAYLMGLMSHYIADLNQPLHTAGQRAGDPNEGEYHSKYEHDVNKYLKNLVLPQVNYNPVTSVQDRVQEMTSEAHKYYFQIGDSYRSGTGLEPLTKITEKQVGKSIENIVDFWCAAFRDARVDIVSPPASFSKEVSWNLKTDGNEDQKRINVNSASVKEMAEFFNISEDKAGKIADGRPYRTAYDLAKTKVFSPMYIKRIKDKIKVK